MFKSLGVKMLAMTLALTFVPAAVPSGVPIVGMSKAEAQGIRFDGRSGDYYGGRRYYRPGRYYDGARGYYGARRGYYRDRYYGRRDNGAAVAAGIIGLGIGAAIASAARPSYGAPVYRGGLSRHDRYCLAKYRSYDPASGTYQPYDGPRRLCR